MQQAGPDWEPKAALANFIRPAPVHCVASETDHGKEGWGGERGGGGPLPQLKIGSASGGEKVKAKF